MSFLQGIQIPGLVGTIEILILAVLFYYLLQFFRGTRAAAILTGLAILFVTLIVITKLINLPVLNWLLQKMLLYLALALIVIFQPEIRRALARFGRQGSFLMTPLRKALAGPIADAAVLLAARRIGALIAIEREVETRTIQDTGTVLGSEVSAELLTTIFFPNTPLHDGGVIISGDCIAAAGCVFPLSQNENLASNLGTRHRAAVGMTEETDTIVIVVSEETGVISIAYNGRLKRGFDGAHLRRVLSSFLGREGAGLQRFARRRPPDDKQLNFMFGEGS